MKISTILDHIDNGHMALPEFQRGYVWNRDQVRGLFDSLYRRHPVGGLLVWATESKTASHRGNASLASGIVKLLLDGQQRMTSLYGVVRGKPPKFFDGNSHAFTGLCFNLETEVFSFYQPIKMKDDPLWVDITELMLKGMPGLGYYISKISSFPDLAPKVGDYISRLSHLLGIVEIDLHIEEVTGADKTLDVVVDIFNRVNSGGTKLSQGDLALARICADWPEARNTMQDKLKEWSNRGFHFNLDWLLRSVNTILTGEAKFQYLHDRSAQEIKDALKRAQKHVDKVLNLITGRLGLDHNQVLFGRYAIPVMVRYLDNMGGQLGEKERDKLLFWFVQVGMWGRFSGSVESYMNQDLEALEKGQGNLDTLLEQLRLWHGAFRVQPDHFFGWSVGARFYPILYLLTRMGAARDWGNGLALKAGLLGQMSRLEVHHIFPKSQLYKSGFKKSEVNAIANFCFQTKETNLAISNQLPEVYLSQIETKHPGALESQWIPMNRELWKIKNYHEFIEARKRLLADETNKILAELLHEDTQWLDGPAETPSKNFIPGGITSADEEKDIDDLNSWIAAQGLPAGTVSYGYIDPKTGEQRAVFDLAWPSGIQQGLSQPVAVLINEENVVLSIASQAGYRVFTSVEDCRRYVQNEILVLETA